MPRLHDQPADETAVGRPGSLTRSCATNALIISATTDVHPRLAGSQARTRGDRVCISESLFRFGNQLVCVERGRSFFYQSAR
jgi:hypothetical protein